MEIDLHGYHPDDVDIVALVRQCWEMGAAQITLIHGHGHNRGISAGFVNTDTGFFGLSVRSVLRHDSALKSFVIRSSLDCSHDGSTTIRLRPNPHATRTKLEMDLIGQPSFPKGVGR